MANNTESLLKELFSADTLSNITKATGVDGDDVTKIISSALPALLKGASGQTNDKSTREGFASALASHAGVDTSDMASFFKKVDLEDGAKIVAHLTGYADKTAAEVARDAGVTKGAASSVLSSISPLLMSLLGKQSNAQSASSNDILSSIGSFLSGDVGSIAKAAIAAYAVSAIKNTVTGKKKTSSKKKTDKKDDIDLSDGLDLGDVMGLVGKIVK